MPDPHLDPDIVKHVVTKLIPALKRSDVYLGVTSQGEPDPQFCLELGVAIMLDKPLVFICPPGTTLPPGLRRIAHHVFEGRSLDDSTLQDDMGRVIKELSRHLA